MAILERMIQKVVNNQWDAVMAQETDTLLADGRVELFWVLD